MTMANFKNNARNFWAGVKNFFSTAWECVNKATGILILLFISMLSVVVCFNPVLFPIWMLFGRRKQAAHLLFGHDQDCWDTLVAALPRALCCWEVKFFPWFMKKDFVLAYPDEFSAKNQVRGARECTQDELDAYIRKLSK